MRRDYVSYLVVDHGSVHIAPSFFHFGLGPFRLQLAQIFFHNLIIVSLRNILAILVRVYALLAVAENHFLAQQPNRLVRDLTFAGALLDGLQIFYWILGTSSLQKKE